MITRFALLVLIAFLQREDKPPAYPPEFAAAVRERQAVRTAQIEWYALMAGGQANDGERYYSVRMAEEDCLTIYRGLANGQMVPKPESVGQPFAFAENRQLLKNGEQWSFDEECLSASIAVDPVQYQPWLDLRKVGFEPTPASSTVESWYRTPCSSYEVSRQANDMVLVTGHWQNGLDVCWILDPTKGMQPVEAAIMRDGEELGRCETTYAQVAEIWFPKEVTFSHRGQATMQLGILHAEFNRAHHSKSLDPNDLGIVPGIQVSHPQYAGPQIWSGTELVSAERWFALVKEGDADNSAFEELLERSKSPTGLCRYAKRFEGELLGLTAFSAGVPGMWEDYTRRFIQRFRLARTQAEKAWSILGECQETAYGRLDELKKIEAESREQLAKIDPKSTADDALKRKAALQERLSKLYEPIERIFHEKLKPSLAKLPTPTQIEAVRDAENKDATRASADSDK